MDAEKPSLPAVAETLEKLETSGASQRRALIATLERWAKAGFPEDAGRLILDHAGYPFPAIDQEPEAPNDGLLRLLWNGKTVVAGEDVEARFPGLDEACRASAIPLLAELGTPSASESPSRVLARMCEGRAPECWLAALAGTGAHAA